MLTIKIYMLERFERNYDEEISRDRWGRFYRIELC